jgi:hypothetical protein
MLFTAVTMNNQTVSDHKIYRLMRDILYTLRNKNVLSYNAVL